MVSVLWATIAAASGLAVYLAIPVVAGALPFSYQRLIASFHYGLSQRALGQTAVVRRVLGGYDLMEFNVDDEEKVAKVTLDSGLLSDEKTLPFKDPDNRMKRYRKKPLAVVPEGVPAVVDAGLSDLAYWTIQHELEDNFESEDVCHQCGGDGVQSNTNGEDERCSGCMGHGKVISVNPFVEMPDHLRFVDPMDTAPFVTKATKPGWLETVRSLTRKRYELFKGSVGATEMIATFGGFALGVGGVIALRYVEQELLDGGTEPGTTLPLMVDAVTDMAVIIA